MTPIEDAGVADLDDILLEEHTLEIPGRGKFVFRELSVEENDAARKAATNEEKQTFDGRTMTRMMIVQSSVRPKITSTTLAKLPQRIYARIVDFVADLNDASSLAEEKEPAGNS